MIVKIRQPFWGAWKMFFWENREEGYGIAEYKIRKCIERKEKLVIQYKNEKYEIGYRSLEKKVLNSPYDWEVRSGVVLKIIPRSWLKHVKEEK